MTHKLRHVIYLVLLGSLYPAASLAQQGSVIRGAVTLRSTGQPVRGATVVITRLGWNAETRADGLFEFANVPPGSYEVVAHMHHLSDERKTVIVNAGAPAVEVNFQLSLSPVREQITVTASGKPETSLETFQSFVSMESIELATKNAATSLGDLLENEAGVAKRSFGPGTTRPVVRGFDGDRVLVLEDGVRTGTLSSQSGDHGEPVDPANVERVEVVRGPATLLYGPNAIGGVVNVINTHHQMHQHPHDGLRGHLNASAGSNNALGGGGGNFEFGKAGWLLWGGGSGMRAGDYHAPSGRIPNSGTDLKRTNAGFGKYADKASFSIGYGLQDGQYGVPFASLFEGQDHDEEMHGGIRFAKAFALRRAEQDDHHHEEDEPIDIKWRRHQLRLSGSIRDLGQQLEEVSLKLNYTDWNHKELHGAEIGTEFFNKQFVYRGDFRQRKRGRLSGAFGFWGMTRDYEAVGEEALAPPVDQRAIALFALEQMDLERVRFQFGGRLEHNRYNARDLRDRSFTGFSGGAGMNAPLWQGGALVANYTHSYRAPALEELYNTGPHVGNVTFEVGDPNLKHESGDGIDLSLRHTSNRVRGEANFFYYRMNNYIFLRPTGEFEDGLPVGEASQADSRFYGFEAKLQTRLHPILWLNLGMDSVNSRLSFNDQPLPRIPPVRGRAGLEIFYQSLAVRPEMILARPQNDTAPNEVRTAGYAALNLNATYSIARNHVLHVFGGTLFNVTDRLYRNHLSFIKEYAPEIGRGVRFHYTLHFF